MAADERWYFTKEQLANTPSRKCGFDADKELSYRQQAANFIQDMGQKLQVTQLCINTAIVYMHRFYVFHSLSQFHRNSIAAAALFLAAKVEEQPRKLEHIIKVMHACLGRVQGPVNIDTKSEGYLEQAADLVFNENVLLQTLGFDVAIDHPHTHVVRCCHLVKGVLFNFTASKDLAQTSYFMASNSLHLTTMCLQYKPTVVACFCIHLACKWSRWEIPQSNEGKHWFWYVDKTVTVELLQQLTGEFLHIFDKCPSRLRKKMRSISANQSPNMVPPMFNSPFETEPRKVQSPANADGPSFQSSRPFEPEVNKKCSTATSGRTSVDYREYREKKGLERLERDKAATATAPAGVPASATTSSTSTSLNNNDPNRHHSHHPKQSSSNSSVSNKHTNSSSSANNMKQGVHHNHHHSSRQDVKSSQMLQQRHSSGNSQSRDSNRDRQKMSSREYTSSMPHGSLDNHNDVSSQESTTVHPPEKLSNNMHRTAHDSRPNDIRHKQQQQQQQKDVKPYGKYPDTSSNSSRTVRKPDMVDQRSEDIRRLIDKPLPPPKPRAEQIKEDFQMMMLKQSHHPSKYGHQPEKPVHNVNLAPASLALPSSESKMLNVGQTALTVEKSPNAPVPASQVHKPLSSSSSINNHMQPVKNGNSSTGMSLGLINNIDDQKADKRSQRGQHELENSVSQTPPPTKHRSLFSPEKTPTPSSRELAMAQRMKQKQKSSPVISSKQDMTLAFASPNLTTSETPSAKQKPTNSSTPLTSQKPHRGLPNLLDNDLDQDSKQQLDHSRKFNSSFGLTDPVSLSNSRYSDLGQSMKNSPLGNKSSTSSLTNIKSEIKPVDNTDPMSNFNQRHKQHHGMSNGIDSSFVKHEYSTIDPSVFQVKPELPDELLENEVPADLILNQVFKQDSKDFLSYQEPLKKEFHEEPDFSTIKRDSYSPLKSAQSISALLQEPLAPMPSLLQTAYEQKHQSIEDDKTSLQFKQEPAVHLLPSTVDMSDITAPIQCPVDLLTPVATPVLPQVTPSATTPVVVEEKKSDHRSKSEKKKEKKKHKHKDKDKSKDKHKHKHKDKDKEKHHRDKGDKEKNNKTDEGNSGSCGTAALSAVPIKITIPKDKINLSTDSIGTLSANTSNSGNSLKIKIPKERLKGTELNTSSSQQQIIQQQLLQQQQQASAPLKLKIRTDAIARSDYQNSSQDGSSRKREHSDVIDNSTVGAPPAKRQQPQLPLQQQQRPNERQNGRHHPYNSGSSNKGDRMTYS